MTKKFNIIIEFIKDLSIETPNAETLIYVRNNLSKYKMNIDINSMPLKNKIIEVNTKLTFQNKELSDKKSFFEIVYASIIKLNEEIKDKIEIEKIILCDLQNIIYPKIEKIFFNIIKDSGYPSIKLENKVDFEKLYKERSN